MRMAGQGGGEGGEGRLGQHSAEASDLSSIFSLTRLYSPIYDTRLMLERLPAEIDPFRLAESRRILRGELALHTMPRLTALLATSDGMVALELEFGIDEVGVRYMRGTLETCVRPVCQRCLQPMTLPLHAEVQFGLAAHERQIEQLPMMYEPLLVNEVPVRLAGIVEDELILSLPQVPMHDEADCPAHAWLMRSKRDDIEHEEDAPANPFAVLSSLKKQKHD